MNTEQNTTPHAEYERIKRQIMFVERVGDAIASLVFGISAYTGYAIGKRYEEDAAGLMIGSSLGLGLGLHLRTMYFVRVGEWAAHRALNVPSGTETAPNTPNASNAPAPYAGRALPLAVLQQARPATVASGNRHGAAGSFGAVNPKVCPNDPSPDRPPTCLASTAPTLRDRRS